MSALEYAQRASKIFVLSDSFIRIKELIDCDKSTIEDIAEVITLDPALASTVLRLANSSFFNYPGKIDTISKAVLILGITEVYNLVIAYFTTEAFNDLTADIGYLDDFWESSVDCALMVKFIGGKMSLRHSERLFILGLLHNIGELVVQQFTPEIVEECANFSINEMPWQKQQSVLGFTYAEVTYQLLKCWQLPSSIAMPIQKQNTLLFEEESPETKLLYIAKRAMIQANYLPNESLSDIISDDYLALINVTHDDIKEAHCYSSMEKLAILNLLNPGAATIY